MILVTILLFIGLVWVIATYVPWSLLGLQSPSATANAQVLQDCAYPITYWREHPELYPAQMVIGGVMYHEKELEALLTDEEINLILQMRSQMAVVYLNISAGADQSSIEGIVFSAYGWLVNHPLGSELTEDDLQAVTQYLTLLEEYNLGQAGVAPCEGTLPLVRTETSTTTLTATPLSSSTPSQTSTPTPSQTPTVTTVTQTPTYPYIFPTNTSAPTTKPPVNPSSTPNITNTPIIPTSQPSPTKTIVPPTATPTLPSPPTPAPTLP